MDSPKSSGSRRSSGSATERPLDAQRPATVVTDSDAGARVYDVLMWNDKKVAVPAFVAGNALFYQVVFGESSLLTLGAHMVAGLILAAIGYVHFGAPAMMTEAESKAAEGKKEESWSTKAAGYHVGVGAVLPLVEAGLTLVNAAVDMFFFVVSGENWQATAGVVLAVEAVASLSGYIGAAGCAWLMFVTAFAWPRVYDAKKAEIDSAVNSAKDTVMSKTNELWEKHGKSIAAKIPRSRKVHAA